MSIEVSKHSTWKILSRPNQNFLFLKLSIPFVLYFYAMNDEHEQKKHQVVEVKRADDGSSPQKSPCTFILLEGTHTSETSTEERDTPVAGQLKEIFVHKESDLSHEVDELNEVECVSGAKKEDTLGYSTETERKPSCSESLRLQLEECKVDNEISNRPVAALICEMNQSIQTIMEIFDSVLTQKIKRSSFERQSESPESQDWRNDRPISHQSHSDQYQKSKLQSFDIRVTDFKSSVLHQPTESICRNSANSESAQHPQLNSNSFQSFDIELTSAAITSVSEVPGNDDTDNCGLTCAELTDSNSNLVIVPMSIYEKLGTSATMLAPCEHTYHTLHIEAASSPTSSVMYRPPLCARLWSVLTDFFTAICLCLQVNRDCIFCLGFFVAFVVSASFLTAFFYRTLNVDERSHHHQEQQHQLQRGQSSSLRHSHTEKLTHPKGYHYF